MTDDIDLGVRTFIAEHIHSVAQLELILLLHAAPEKSWSADEAARAFGLSPEMTENLLKGLEREGFAKATPPGGEPRRGYAPQSDELDRYVAQLAILYQQRRVSVIQVIHSQPVEKLQSFADAFRFRKGKEED